MKGPVWFDRIEDGAEAKRTGYISGVSQLWLRGLSIRKVTSSGTLKYTDKETDKHYLKIDKVV